MKKWLFLAACLGPLSGVVSAAEKLEIGFRAGAGSTHVESTGYDAGGSDRKAAVGAGLFAERRISGVLHASLGVEYDERRGEGTETITYYVSDDQPRVPVPFHVSDRLRLLGVPVLLSARSRTGAVRPFVSAGVRLSYLLSGQRDLEALGDAGTLRRGTILRGADDDLFRTWAVEPEVRAGMVFALDEGWSGRVDARYTPALTNFARSRPLPGYISDSRYFRADVLSLNVGISFPL